MPNAQAEYEAWWLEVRYVLQAARIALGATSTTDIVKKLHTGGNGLKALVNIAMKHPEHHSWLLAPVPADTPVMGLPEAQQKALTLAAVQYPRLMARLKAGGLSPSPGVVVPVSPDSAPLPAPSGPVLVVAEAPASWPVAPASKPRKEPDPAAIRQRQRKALLRRFGPVAAPVTTETTEVVAEEPEPWAAALELEPDGDSWRLVLVVEPLHKLPSFCKKLQLASDREPMLLLGSNLRSGVSRLAVSPSVQPYRFEAPGWEEDVGPLLAPMEQPGFSAERATLFRIHAQGRATPAAGTRVPLCARMLVLVPPSLAGVALPPGWHPLTEGWRLLPLRLELPLAAGQQELLASLGLQAGESGLEVDWAGAGAVRYTPGHDGSAYPCFAKNPVVALERSGVAQRLWVLLTSGSDEATLELEAGTGRTLVSLGELPAGAYALDVVSESAELSERLFFSIGEAAPLPAAQVTAEVAGEPPIVLTQSGGGLDVKLSRLRLGFRGPPGWPLWVRWSGNRPRVLGSLSANAEGRIDEQDVQALLAPVVAEQVGDVEVTAGELGRMVLCHETELDRAATVEAITRLFHERWPSLGALAQDPGLLKTILLAPIVTRLGLRLDTAALPAAGAVGWRLGRVFRDGKAVVTCWDEVLVAVPAGALQPGEPLSEAQRKTWQGVLREHQLRRVLLTDGRCWTVVERGQRMRLPPVDLGGAGTMEAPGCVELLLRVVQP